MRANGKIESIFLLMIGVGIPSMQDFLLSSDSTPSLEVVSICAGIRSGPKVPRIRCIRF